MYSQPRGIANYGRIANAETSSLKQIVMLYDGAIKFINLTAADIENKDYVAKAEHSNRAFDIINYLQSILDFERGGEVAVSLDNLYRQITALMLKASAKLDAAQMRRAAQLLAPVREAWETNARNVSIPTPSYSAAATQGKNVGATVKMAF